MTIQEESMLNEIFLSNTQTTKSYVAPISNATSSQKETNPTIRLIITHIENINFKSYAGKQVLGPFHKNFTSIVGPNGSGKSNVIDAMLFVFGYRSQKIRSKKLSLLIHNSESHLNIESCTVTVHFQKIIDLPGEDFELVENTHFTISRTARKDGSSDYYLDGKKQTFKEIGLVLRTCGIDIDHNRFLILQGEVEQISTMKPKAENEHDEGMLEYLEDIIGTSSYKVPIDELSAAVEDLNEKRSEKLNRAKVVLNEKEELEQEKEDATTFLVMENNITKKNYILCQKYIHDCTEIESKTKSKEVEIKQQLEKLQLQLSSFLEQKKEKGVEYKKMNKLYDKLFIEAEEKKKAFAEFEKYDLKLREELKHRKKNKKTLEKSLETEKIKLEELKTIPAKSEAEIEQCTSSLKQLEIQKQLEENVLTEIMAGLKNETEGLQQEKESKELALMESQKSVNEAKSKLDVLSSELEIYLSKYTKLNEQLEQAKSNAEKAKEQNEEKKRQLIAIEEDLPSTKKELDSAEKELKQVTQNEKDLSIEVKKNRHKFEECRSAMHASQSRDAVLDALMKEKESGRIPGIYGRLGDLGAIENKYDIAISTACGPLDFIVVDTMDTAQKGVQFLKKNNIGSTTFIALDKVSNCEQKANSKINTPENVPRLFDLVKLKTEDVRNAFYFALKDTLVANNLDQATRIAYPKDKNSSRWRVVTLKGELIEMSGTMSGGGNRPSKGRIGNRLTQDYNPNDIEILEKKFYSDTKMLEELQQRKTKLEDTVHNLTKQVKSMEHEVQKLKMEIQALSAQEKEQLLRVQQLSCDLKAAKPDAQHEAKLEKEIAIHNKTYTKAAEISGKIEKEVQSLHKKIMDIGKSKLSGQQSKLDSLSKLIDEVTQKKTKASVAIKNASRNLKKAEEKVESIEKEIKENTAALLNIEQVELKKLEDDATEVLNAAQEGQERIKEMQKKLEEAKRAFEATDKEEGDLRSKEIDVKHELQKFENTLKENSNKIRHWKDKLDKLVLHKIRKSYVESESQHEELVKLTNEQLADVDDTAIAYEITVLSEKLAEMKPNMAAIEEYFKKEEIYLERVKELETVTEERDSKRKDLDNMRKRRLDEFMSGFVIITAKLKEMYQMITLGGDAELELIDSLDPFSDGVVFSVRPPKKTWKNISNLSGGEKTLSSLALVFALHHYKPSPLYVMDEIDAALDFKNVSIIANYIKERTKNAQFIIISLRNNMFELADRLVGIYKTDNCTKSVIINPSSL
ncbi:structural maintenance of chromosomes protein 4 isoform X1 [Hydra vulgaris]|nr:structural maintenance of chromosomes protein 4 [Hydra vulgaris]